MTTYDNLPVYKTTYDLLLLIFAIIKEFPKEYKYTLWDTIKNKLIILIENIYRANCSFENRHRNIKNAREDIEVIRLYIRLCKDVKLINLTKFIDLNEKIESISKQLSLWEKYTVK